MKKIGIIGLGTIGTELGQRMSAYNMIVYGVDPNSAARERAKEKGMAYTYGQIDELPEGLQAIIECAPEKYGVKKRILQEVAKKYPNADVLIMTTSSTFPSRVFVKEVSYPERLLNAHVLPDFRVRKFCEFQTSGHTTETNMKKAVEIFQDIDLETVVIKGECEGYIFNRMWHHMVGVSLSLLDSYGFREIDANCARAVGAPYGSMFGIDYVGLDTLAAIARRTGTQLPEQVTSKIRDGNLGVKTGKGFYEHNGNLPDYTGVPEVPEIIKAFRVQLKKDCESLITDGQREEDILSAVQNGYPATINPFHWDGENTKPLWRDKNVR